MGYLEHQLELYERCLEPFKKPDDSLCEDLTHDEDWKLKAILRNIEELKKEIKMREITKPYYELLVEGIKYIKADDSIKSLRQAANLLKKDLTEVAEEIDGKISIYGDDIKISNKNPVSRSETTHIILRKYLDKFSIDNDLFHINDVLLDDIHFKQYRALLFLVSWLFKSPTEENMSLLRETVKRMKNEFYVNQKIDEMNTNLLENSLVMLAKKHGIKYQIEKENTFCTVTFRLRPYYKLEVRLLYSELSQQLSDLSGVLEKSLEITASSLVPQISVNRSYECLSK